MREKILFTLMVTFCFMPFIKADLHINLNSAVKTGTYYTFPDLSVTADNASDRGYVIRIMFTRATVSADAITLPSLPTGFTQNTNSTQYVRMIDITAGATAADIQSFLRLVQISFASGKQGQGIMILLSESSADAGRRVYYSSDTDHWYEYVTSPQIIWTNAYNESLDKQFMGMNGYLAVITSKPENDFIYTVTSGAVGWIGGTRMDIRSVQDASTGKLSGNASNELQYWYWAAGPEWDENGKDPLNSVFYNKMTYNSAEQNVPVTYNYNSWSGSEPNNSGGGILYAFISYRLME